MNIRHLNVQFKAQRDCKIPKELSVCTVVELKKTRDFAAQSILQLKKYINLLLHTVVELERT